jgi:Sporulation and spore germination
VIPRYQRILFWTLAGCIGLMTLFLLRGCQQAHKRLAISPDTTPIAAPNPSATEDFTLYLADDSDGSITTSTASLVLPREPTLRARALLQHLLTGYAAPTSHHLLSTGPAVDDVFLLNLPAAPVYDPATAPIAVVNLHGAFAQSHPSGVLIEDLTIQSIVGTLHAAFPQLTEVRFLVDGQPHDTLAGHADLQRSYAAVDTSFKPSPPTQETHP